MRIETIESASAGSLKAGSKSPKSQRRKAARIREPFDKVAACMVSASELVEIDRLAASMGLTRSAFLARHLRRSLRFNRSGNARG